jgi:hypothetical protein
MKDCPSTDALATIAGALEWDVEAGMRHLNSCALCAEQLQMLQITHDAYEERAEISPSDVNSIMQAIAQESARERVRGRRTRTLGDIVEALLAGGTAVTVISASAGAAPTNVMVLTFAIVATALFGYRKFNAHEMLTP